MASNWLETIPSGNAVKLAGCVDYLAGHQKSGTIGFLKNTLASLVERVSRVQVLLEELHKQPHEWEGQETTLRSMMIDFIYPLFWLHEDIEYFSKESSACRLIRHQKLLHSFRQAHEATNEFVREMHELTRNNQFVVCTEDQWRDVMALDLNQKQMDEISTVICGELNGEEQQHAKRKVLSILAYELTRNRRRGTSFLILQDLQNEIAQAHQVVLESWFIPSDEIRAKKTINEGGYGEVFVGKWGETTVAVKRMCSVKKARSVKADSAQQAQDDLAREANAIANMAREINIWHRLDHPHILKFYGATYVDKDCSIVSEFAPGGQLNEYLAIKQNTSRLWHLLYEAALGIEYLHRQNVVHADLKCNNILVGGDGKCKIMDFGLSFYNGDHADVVCTEAFQWLAPECFLNGAARSFATDVFMFGMCIVQAVTGQVPWGKNVTSAAQVQRFFSLGQLPVSIKVMDQDPQRLVMQMCKMKPEDRMLMHDVVSHLKKLADGQRGAL